MDEELAADFGAMGAEIAPSSASAAADRDVYEVWPCNWEALRVFIGCQTQWRMLATPAGLYHLGLDYPAIDVVMRRLRVSDPDGHVFDQIQDMEAAALSAFAEGRQ
ncbi:DUF1799 domain-containing protein [Tistrella bauzanensis]|uniref:DUF1799 domain-containing protein n=1 Tax=Tistrella TaxID=171436 RepID=UPI0031F63FA1